MNGSQMVDGQQQLDMQGFLGGLIGRTLGGFVGNKIGGSTGRTIGSIAGGGLGDHAVEVAARRGPEMIRLLGRDDGKSHSGQFAAHGDAGVSPEGFRHPEIVAEPVGRVASVTDALNDQTLNVFDLAGQLVQTRNPLGAWNQSAYNRRGWLTQSTDALGDITTTAFDAVGDQTAVTDPLGHTTCYSYFPAPARQLQTRTDAQPALTSYAYYPGGALKSVRYGGLGTATPDVGYTYYPDGAPKTMTDGTGTTAYRYNQAGLLASVVLSLVLIPSLDARGAAIAFTAAELLVGTSCFVALRRADPELVTTGPYRWIRHPIYSGLLLGLAGTAIAVSAYWLIAVAIVSAYFLVSAIVEERTMAKLFPAAYPPYQRVTKMLIPYLL